jgi:Ca2+-binding RTX toxin-like protein
LDHPHDGYTFPKGYDQTKYTLMSYEQYRYDLYETSPMVYDIAAIQHLYGANETTNLSNTIYKFDSGIGTNDVGPMLNTIWDSGGIDILDMGEILNPSDINLNGGEYSKIGYSNWINDYDLGIAFGTVIENVNGGKAADTIRGNEFSNQIDGGGGDDIIYGGDGSDIFVCSSGGGVDVIKDFNVSEDLVAFLEYGQTFTKNYSHSEDAQGNLVVSMLDGSGSLILENVAVGTELIIA